MGVFLIVLGSSVLSCSGGSLTFRVVFFFVEFNFIITHSAKMIFLFISFICFFCFFWIVIFVFFPQFLVIVPFSIVSV